jgi:hypothetical protein
MRMLHSPRPVPALASGLALLAACCTSSLGADSVSAPSLNIAPVVMGQTSNQPATAPAEPATDLATLPNAGAAAFGASGSTWWGVGGGGAFGFGDVDGKGYVTISHFLAEDLEVTGELAGWYLSLHNDDAAVDDDGSTGGVSVSGILRYHVVNTGTWTVFIDGGIGVLFAGDDVPAGGSEFNFLPRVGAGFTARVSGETRLQVGASWHHISNADISGDDENPGRDGVMVYAGLLFAF